VNAKLAPRAIAVGVDGSFRHAQLAGDLFGAQMLIDKPKAFTLTRREQLNAILIDIGARRHNGHSKRRLRGRVYFNARRRRPFIADRDTKTPQFGPARFA
jgi:hypothetical protein